MTDEHKNEWSERCACRIGPMLCFIALLALIGSASTLASAADIEIDQKAIEIRGELVKGDAGRFEDALRRIGPEVFMVKLRASPGGDLREAITIGNLVRRLRLTTDVATLAQSGPVIGLSPVANADGSKDAIIGTDEW